MTTSACLSARRPSSSPGEPKSSASPGAYSLLWRQASSRSCGTEICPLGKPGEGLELNKLIAQKGSCDIAAPMPEDRRGLGGARGAQLLVVRLMRRSYIQTSVTSHLGHRLAAPDYSDRVPGARDGRLVRHFFRDGSCRARIRRGGPSGNGARDSAARRDDGPRGASHASRAFRGRVLRGRRDRGLELSCFGLLSFEGAVP